MPEIRPTFRSWADRFTYVVAEAQLLTAGILVFLGLIIGVARPDLPHVPRWVMDFAAAALILGPPLFLAGLRFARWLRVRNAVEVFHVNAVTDDVEKYLVPPEIWAEKTVEGPDPWAVNGSSAWAVREFDWHGETEDLIVRGVWLSELEDQKVLTSKDHMESMYSKLTEAYISLGIMRDSISELGSDLQHRLINRLAQARERGEMLDKTAVKEVFEDYEERAESVTETDLPTLDEEDLPDFDQLADPSPESDAPKRGNGLAEEQEAVATDGGES
ncbi:MAG: hypothetical protein ABEJ68_07665 [Halobacteriaceae archaeon]